MILLDANILLYAYHAESPHHRAAATWLDELLAGLEPIGVPWATLWAFIRVSTNPRVWSHATPATDVVFQAIRELLSQPGVVIIHPGPRHMEVLEHLVTTCNAAGPLVSDAVLAALALEHNATLASTDRDFGRFHDLRWVNPIQP